ncbi:hypothetical protein KW868_00640 [Acinetobacter guillouiae]|uniref:Uncharacterized protein n=1 Tax=Acinetobacter guillouiae TaxID=106649 RepID=A0A8X8GEN3_ACIGI|nr:hypothetical protein [Acinetobacter guillouiae]MCF0262981.1 hypothetical protein [Acinetobacter guillouiae]
MIPLLKAGNTPNSSGELLENVADSVQKLEINIATLSRVHYDDGLPSSEFNAIMCGLHLQVHEIYQQLKHNS